MSRTTKTRLAALAAAGALVIGTGLSAAMPASADSKSGGTVTIAEISTPDHWDPQRIYTGEDLAMMGTFLFRSLTQYKPVSGAQGNEIQGDIATNTGVPTNLAKTWTFTLKSGVTFQDGSAVNCADVKYAVSRVFAQDTITDGPAYPLTMLATSYAKYFGPYVSQTTASNAELDKGIWCGTPADQKAKKQYPTGKVITFNLVRSVADFNYSTTLLSYSPVQKSKDSGEGYDRAPQATGPYMITHYPEDIEAPDYFELSRNSNYNAGSDGTRNAYPDKIILKTNQDPSVLDNAFITDTASSSVLLGTVQVANRSRVWNTDGTFKTVAQGAESNFNGRVYNAYDPYVSYVAFNLKTGNASGRNYGVNCLPLRKALLYTLDRKALLALNGGPGLAGDYADGTIKPSMGADYKAIAFDSSFGDFSGATTGSATSVYNAKTKKTTTTIDAGSGSFAAAYKWLQTAKADKTQGCKDAVANATGSNGLVYERSRDTASGRLALAVWGDSLGKLGMKVTPRFNPVGYYPRVLDTNWDGDLGGAGWGPDWANASTVVPELFGKDGGFNVNKTWYDKKYSGFASLLKAANGTTDRAVQSSYWQKLNQYAMDQAWVIPTFFTKTQRIWGSNVGGNYQWAPYGSYAYNDLYLKDNTKSDS